jgi:hypothetical protein
MNRLMLSNGRISRGDLWQGSPVGNFATVMAHEATLGQLRGNARATT